MSSKRRRRTPAKEDPPGRAGDARRPREHRRHTEEKEDDTEDEVFNPADVVVPGIEYKSPATRTLPALPPTGCVGLSHRDERRGHAMVHASRFLVNHLALDMERATTAAAAPLVRIPFRGADGAMHWFDLDNPALFQGFCTPAELDQFVGCLRHVMIENAKASTHRHRIATALRPGAAVSYQWRTPIVPVAPQMRDLFFTLERYTTHTNASIQAQKAEEKKKTRKRR